MKRIPKIILFLLLTISINTFPLLSNKTQPNKDLETAVKKLAQVSPEQKRTWGTFLKRLGFSTLLIGIITSFIYAAIKNMPTPPTREEFNELFYSTIKYVSSRFETKTQATTKENIEPPIRIHKQKRFDCDNNIPIPSGATIVMCRTEGDFPLQEKNILIQIKDTANVIRYTELPVSS